MSLSFVGKADAVAATVNLPAFAAGDIAVVLAFRDGSTTAPTLPAGWTDINSGSTGSGGTAGSHRSGYRVLVGGDTTTGTWTNATDIQVVVLRGQASTPIGKESMSGGATNLPTFGALAQFDDQGDSSWTLLMAASRTATDMNVPSISGATQRAPTNGSMSLHTREAVSSAGGTNLNAVVNAATTWRGHQIEIRAARTSSMTPSVLTQGVKTIDAATATTASFTEPSGGEMLAIVSHWAGANVRPAPTATGWTQIATIDQGGGYRITMLRKTGAGATGTVVWSCGTDVQSAWEWIIYSLVGAATGASGFGTAQTQQGSAVASVSMNALAALQDPNSIMFAAIATGVSENVTPTVGFNVEDRDDITADFGTFEAHRKIQERLARFDWTTATIYSSISVEVKAAAAAVSVNAGLASGTGAAAGPKVDEKVNAGAASGTGAAPNATPGEKVNAGVATGAGQAFNAQVATGLTVVAGVASGTGQALAPSVAVKVNAGAASGTGQALNPGRGVGAGVASGVGQALNTSSAVKVNAGVASGVGAAYNPSIPAPGPAVVVGRPPRSIYVCAEPRGRVEPKVCAEWSPRPAPFVCAP